MASSGLRSILKASIGSRRVRAGATIQNLGTAMKAVTWEKSLTQEKATEEQIPDFPPPALQLPTTASYWPNLSGNIIPYDIEQSKGRVGTGSESKQAMAGTLVYSKQKRKIPLPLTWSNQATPRQVFSCLSDSICLATQLEDTTLSVISVIDFVWDPTHVS